MERETLRINDSRLRNGCIMFHIETGDLLDRVSFVTEPKLRQ